VNLYQSGAQNMARLMTFRRSILSIISTIFLLFASLAKAESDINTLVELIKDIEMRTGWKYVQSTAYDPVTQNVSYIFNTHLNGSNDGRGLKVQISDLTTFRNDVVTKGEPKIKAGGVCCYFPQNEKQVAREIAKITNWKLAVIDKTTSLEFTFTDSDNFMSSTEKVEELLTKITYYENPKIGLNRQIFFSGHERHIAKIMAEQMNVDVTFKETNHSITSTFKDPQTSHAFSIIAGIDDFKDFAAKSGGAKKIKNKLFNASNFTAAEDVSAATGWKLKNIFFQDSQIQFEFADSNHESITTTEPKKILNKMIKSSKLPLIEDGLLTWSKASVARCSMLFN
jgi:hypothetical protein